jgi:NodT family efflux transporter outer membrane factor (OMF) lipoprotein
MTTIKPLSLLLLAAGLAGCDVGPDYHEPAEKPPAAFMETTAPTVAAAPGVEGQIAPDSWWRSLNDPELNSLIERAIEFGPDLQIALARLQEARTQEFVTAGEALPEAEFSGGAGRGSGTNSVRGRVAQPIYAGTTTTGLKEITEIAGLDAAWELDLFGKYRRALEAAKADTQAAAELRNAVLITLVSDVARGYMDLRGLQMRLAVARKNIERAEKAADLLQTRFDRGLTNELDLSVAKRQLATFKSQLAPLEAGVTAAANRIAVLLGRYPEDLAAELAAPGVIPPLPAQLQPGLPLDLLKRRPDIREAERQLAAATARIGVATASLFPSVVVSAGLGMQGQGLGRIPVSDSFIWSAGPAAYWPLLDFGTIDALISVEDLRAQELLVNYRRAVIVGVEEVDNAIASYAAEQDRLSNLTDALEASRRAVSLATQRYDRGLTDFLNVLDAQRQEFDLEDQYATGQETASFQLIALYKALGGGWEPYQSVPPVHTPEPAILAAFRRMMSPSGESDEFPQPGK